MTEKRALDSAGAAGLLAIAALLAFNQVVIKVTSVGFSPVFQAGVRSALAMVLLLLWMRWRGIEIVTSRPVVLAGILSGLLFTGEFVGLFVALDLTTVSRVSILLYSMPVWLALAAHFLLPGERLTGGRALGLALAMGGVALAVLDRNGGTASLTGDLLALLAAMMWAGIALCVRMTRLSETRAEVQLAFQLMVSAPLLLMLAPLFGPLLREPTPLHVAGLAYQTIGIAFLSFLFWFKLLATYHASAVASFSFLSPVLAVFMGWALLGETIAVQIWGALVLVAAGIFLINRR